MLFWRLWASTEFLLPKTRGLFRAGRRANSYQTAAQTIMKSLNFKRRKSKLAQGLCSHLAQLHENEAFIRNGRKREMEF